MYDTTFGADLTVMEEADEFLERLKKGGPFPMFTSCCPAWIKYLEKENPKYLKNVSTCKSPMEMFAAVLKDQYREKDAADGRTTYHIAIMPCTAKKMEAQRPEFCHDGTPDVNLVLTTQEIIMMIKESGIRFDELEGEAPDLPFGMGTGAATIFGHHRRAWRRLWPAAWWRTSPKTPCRPSSSRAFGARIPSVRFRCRWETGCCASPWCMAL